MTSSTRVGSPPRAPDQTVVYAIGDVHGRLDLLERLTEQLAVETEAAARDGKGTIAVFLGDYIDKGPDAAGVVEHLIRFRDQAACETIFLRGNHEDVLISLVDGDEDSARWLEYGGVETLRSYGVSFRAANPNPSVEKLRQTAIGAIPAEHIAFLRETELHVALGDYIFVHAGLRPDRLIEEQTDSDMMWFRYYDDEPPIWSGTVVHGHSVNARPIRGRARIGIDTGAYATDALTALRLEGDRQDFLKVSLNPEDGTPEVDFWDTVDRAFAGGVRPAAPGAGRHRAAQSTPRAASAKRAKPAARKPARQAKAKAAKAKPVRSGKGAPFPAVGVAAAAAAALAAASVAAVILYKPRLEAVDSDLSPQKVAAEMRSEVPQGAATLPASAPADGPASAASGDTNAALRPLSPSMATDSERPTPEPAPEPAPTPKAAPTPTTKASAPAAPQPPRQQRPPAATTSNAPAAPLGPPGSVRVQIAAAPSAADAQREWVATARKFPAEMNGKGLQTEEVQVDGRTLFRTMVAGFTSVEEARGFCDRLRQSGRGCIVRSGG